MKRWVVRNPNLKREADFDPDDYDEWVPTCSCGFGFWVKGEGISVELYGRDIVLESTVKEAVDNGVHGVSGDGVKDWLSEKGDEKYRDLVAVDGKTVPDDVSCRVLDEREVDPEWLHESKDAEYYVRPDRWSIDTYETGRTWQWKGRNRGRKTIEISSDDEDEVTSVLKCKRDLKIPKKEQNMTVLSF